jgi:hypothetical protein
MQEQQSTTKSGFLLLDPKGSLQAVRRTSGRHDFRSLLRAAMITISAEGAGILRVGGQGTIKSGAAT